MLLMCISMLMYQIRAGRDQCQYERCSRLNIRRQLSTLCGLADVSGGPSFRLRLLRMTDASVLKYWTHDLWPQQLHQVLLLPVRSGSPSKLQTLFVRLWAVLFPMMPCDCNGSDCSRSVAHAVVPSGAQWSSQSLLVPGSRWCSALAGVCVCVSERIDVPLPPWDYRLL